MVLGGHTRVQNPTANFHNSFEGKATAYGMTNGLYKIIFSYAGFENAFNVANEVKVILKLLLLLLFLKKNPPFYALIHFLTS